MPDTWTGSGDGANKTDMALNHKLLTTKMNRSSQRSEQGIRNQWTETGRKGLQKLGMVAYTYNPSIQKAKAGRWPRVQDQPGQQSELQDILGYRKRNLKNKQTNKPPTPRRKERGR